jgi:hypothetical protein
MSGDLVFGAGLERLEEAGRLLGAKTLDDVGRVLLAAEGDGHQPWVAAASFRSVRAAYPKDAGECALLLCTDPRWSRMTAQLVGPILEGELLSGRELDRLADLFLWRECAVINHPAGWLEGRPGRKSGRRAKGTVTAIRQIEPPMRRWAAAHVLKRQPERHEQVLTRARALRGPAGAAVAGGMVDAIDALPEESAEMIMETGLGWPSANVRIAALSVLARRDGPAAALEMAAQDPNARVRRWRPPGMRTAERQAASQDAGAERSPAAGAQMPLFSKPDDSSGD